mmetsp:Transcript_86963/g.251181  ORF Transcript_86963/g.251181 Transcript_86963/m.251181 type:complete len:200 (-) Transcript_86963:888-1487(-)
MREEVGQSGFLHGNDLSVLILLRQVVQVDNAGDGCSDKPGKSQKSVDHVAETVQEEIPVVRFTVLETVGGIVNQVPSDTVVKVEQDEREDSWTGSEERSVALSVQVSHLREPRSSSPWLRLVLALVRPEGAAGRVATSIRGLKLVGYIQSRNLNVRESDASNDGPDDNRERDGKVVNRVSNILVAAETGRLEAAEEEDG